MKKFFVLTVFAIASVAFASCNRDPGNDDTKEYVMVTTDATTVCINEVCGVVGSKGVELYNPTDQEIVLTGYTLVKNEAKDENDATKDAATWTGASTDKIAAKGFYVITAKKEFDDIKDVANAKAGDSFSPSKALKLELKKDGVVVDTFDRGFDKNNKTEATLKTLEGSCARVEDGKATWKVMAITIGKTNKGAEEIGNVDIEP